MRNRILRFLLIFSAVTYPAAFLALSVRDTGPWLLLLYAVAWGITCAGWIHKFCREEWLELSMSVYGGVTVCVVVLSVLWTALTFLGDTADGLCALCASLGICLPYLVFYAYGKWQDGRGDFPVGTPPTVLSVVLYTFVIALPLLRVGVRLLGEWIYQGHPQVAMEYYRNTPRELYQGEVTVFTVLFLLSPVLCLGAGWLAKGKRSVHTPS